MRFMAPLPLVLVAVGFGLLTVRAGAGEAPAGGGRANVVFVLADDLGWADIGCQGSGFYETPNIDRLASQGMRFTRHYHCQNCTPTRAALMSGQYGARTGVFTVGTSERGAAKDRNLVPVANQTHLPLDRKTVADQMKAAGYATAMFGKWHIGQNDAYHPGRRGFDEAIVSMGKHFDFNTNPKADVPGGVYLADWLTDRSIQFIERNKDKPFFLYLPHFAVHVPHQAKKELVEKFRKKAAPKEGTSPFHSDPVYAAMIYSVDESVGRVMKKLEELGLAENTVLIFSSDNGGVGGYREIGGKGVTDNAPLRGGKGMLYEGGVRVPFIVRWPGVVKAGTTCDVPTTHVDFMPTMLEVAGAPRPPQVLDGVSLVPLLKDPAAGLKREAVFAHMPGYLEGYGTGQWRTTPAGYVVAGDWKLIEFFETGRLELYDLKGDVGEKADLSAKMPEKVKEMHARLVAWRQETGAAMPRAKTAADAGKEQAPARPGRARRNARGAEQ